MGWGKASSGWSDAIGNSLTLGTTVLGAASFLPPGLNIIAGIGGAFVGLGLSIGSHNKRQDEKIDNLKLQRKNATQLRNKALRDFQRFYDTTRSDFDTKYGAGLFDQLDMDFQKILGMDNTRSISAILDSFEYEKTSGEITNKLNGDSAKISIKSQELYTENSFNLQDFANEYIRVLGDKLKQADTEFGLQMQSFSNQEKQAIEDYNDTMAEARIQAARSFQDAFLNRKAQVMQEQLNAGQASVAQATSGIRQTGSGVNLTIQQEFQQDLSKVAYVSLMRNYISQYEMSSAQYNRQLRNNIYQVRNSIALGTKGMLASVQTSMNTYQSGVIQTIDEMKDQESAVDTFNDAIGDANDDKFFTDRDIETEILTAGEYF